MMQAPAQTISQAIRDQRRDRILQVARAVFFEAGYASATMSTIAARLGGSKATLYAYFKSKEELFRAIVCEQCALVQGLVEDPKPGEDVRQALIRIGERLLSLLMADASIRTLRLIVEEGPRAPELAALFMQAGPQLGERRLAEFFAEACEDGRLKPVDPVTAARQFSALVKGNLHLRGLLGLIDDPQPEVIRAEVEAAVDMFLAAYGPAPVAG